MQPPKGTLCRSVLIFCLLVCFSAIKAQKAIHFEDISFEEAVEKAKAQKKIVFVDVRGMNSNAFTEKVDKEIFTLDSIADFFNANIISIRVIMNSEEGKKFAPRLAMLMYPVYVFHGSNGDQLDFTNSGSITKDPGVLMEKARSSLATNKMKNSNTRSITFTQDSWKDILGKALFQNKLIFLDAQTTWCRPCIMMAKDIFTLDRVADFYNQNFINVTMDMEKGDGPALRKQYGINAYPSFLYIDGTGKLVHHDGGYQEADRFIENGKTAVAQKAAGTSTGPSASFHSSSGSVPARDSVAVPAGGGTKPVALEDASDTGMHFTEGTWASLLARARQTGKLIFVDANTTWCGPCKQMRREIFPQKAVALLYNHNFFNVDLDMEKGEGLDFRKKYGVKAYPTFLYINGDGEVVHKTVGSCDAAEFQQHALDAMSPHRNLLFLQTEYKDKQKDEAFVTIYLAALRDAYETSKADSVAVAFLDSKDPSDWKQFNTWLLTKEYVNDATSAVFRSLVKEQAAYGKLYGAEEVETKIYQTYLGWPQHYLHYPEKGAATLDPEPFDEFLRQVKKSSYARKGEIEARSRLTVYFGLRDWNNYAATVNGMLSNHIVPMDAKGAEWLYSFADMINRFSGDDKQVLSDAVKWTKLISNDIDGVSPSDKATYLDLYASLLEKTGQADMAVQVRKEINQQQLTNAKQNAPFQTLMRIVPKQN
jgi:thiol-disulfide isomerase/thioredoxin